MKRKTERAYQQLFLNAAIGVLPPNLPSGEPGDIPDVGGAPVLYTSQEDQTGRLLPCIIIDCAEGDPVTAQGSNQERRKTMISILSSAMRNQTADTAPAILHQALVEQVRDLLRSLTTGSNRTGSLARALTSAAHTAGLDHYTCLYTLPFVPRECEPIDQHLAETFEQTVGLIEVDT